MATALGARLLYRYSVGTATLEQISKALIAGWISQTEYDVATNSTA